MENNAENYFEKYYVIDTNIILSDAHSIKTLSDNSQNLIIIPETVLDELDSKKRGFEEINYQAREFGRLLSDAQVISMNNGSEDCKIIELRINHGLNIRIDIISKDEYKADKSQSVPANIINDRKILEIAKFAQSHYLKNTDTQNNFWFLSLDIMARTRAISVNIPTNTLTGMHDDTFDYNFHKTISVDKEFTTEELYGTLITDLDSTHECHNFSYSLKLPSGRVILASIHQERIKPIDEDEIRRQSVGPKNTEQLFFANAIIEDNYHILVVDAKAGSGKTLLALSGAMKLVKKKRSSKIVYIRNSVESLDKGEDVGYLSGNEEKFKIYNHPLMDCIEYIVRSEMKKSINNKSNGKVSDINNTTVQEKIEETMSKFSIETMWTGALRGRTISDAIVIIDEAQNISNKSMQLILTRIDASCKVMILGSTNQIDNFYINKHTNGMTTILNSTKTKYDHVNLFSITLTKVLRGPITEWAEQLFSN